MNVYQWAIKLQDMMSPALQRAQAAYARFGSGWQQMTARLPRGLNMATQSIADLKKKLDSLRGARELMVDTRQIRRATSEINQLQRQMDRLEGRGGSGGGGLLGKAKGLLPALGLAGLLAGAGGLATSGMDREQTKVGFEQFVGKDGVNPMMKQLNRFADVTPYDNEQVYSAGRSLLAAHVDPNKLNEKMGNIGNMAAVSQKDFGDLSQTYAKIKQKGFIDGGELHQEFGGTALMSQLKKNLKVGGDELFKLAEQRKIKFADVDKAIADLSAKGGLYEGGLDKLSKTAGGKWSTFLGTLQNKVTELAEKLNPMLGKLFDFGSSLLAKIDPVIEIISGAFMKLWDAVEPVRTLFSELWNVVTRTFTAFGGGAGAMQAFNVVVDVLAAVLWTISKALQYAGELVLWLATGPLKWLVAIVGGVTAAWWLFNAAMTANPIGIVVVAITALVAGIKYAWDHIDGFRHALISMWEVAKSVFGSLGKAWDALLKGDFSGVADALKKGWTDGMANAHAAVGIDTLARLQEARAGKKKSEEGSHKFAFKEEEEYGSKGKGGSKAAGKAGGLDSTVSGAKSTNITINLKSLVDGGVHVHTATLTEGLAEIERMCEDAFLRILNSANSVPS